EPLVRLHMLNEVNRSDRALAEPLEDAVAPPDDDPRRDGLGGHARGFLVLAGGTGLASHGEISSLEEQQLPIPAPATIATLWAQAITSATARLLSRWTYLSSRTCCALSATSVDSEDRSQMHRLVKLFLVLLSASCSPAGPPNERAGSVSAALAPSLDAAT